MWNLYLSIAFLIATIFTIQVDPSIKKDLLKQLTKEEQAHYKDITKMRQTIYFQGLGLGFLLSLLFIYVNKIKNKSTTLLYAISITFIVNYFYYILYPKDKYMISILDTKEENEAWLKIYRTMQVRYHIGFLLGLIAAVFLQHYIINSVS